MDVKTIGSSGQISVGKQHAGRIVTVEEIEDGVWLVKTARVIPENELWLQNPAAKATIDRAVEWAEKNKPRPTDLGKLERGFKKGR